MVLMYSVAVIFSVNCGAAQLLRAFEGNHLIFFDSLYSFFLFAAASQPHMIILLLSFLSNFLLCSVLLGTPELLL